MHVWGVFGFSSTIVIILSFSSGRKQVLAMKSLFPALFALLCCSACVDSSALDLPADVEPQGTGPYSVGSTNMEVAPEYADIGDEAMHELLLGRAAEAEPPRFLADILKYPEAAWITNVRVPDEPAMYGPASGLSLPVVTFLTYPSSPKQQQNSYAFPYHDGRYGIFEDMLGAGEMPDFADPDKRYPLIILSHGGSAHGIYDVTHAHSLARHGYVVAVINYGDDRTAIADSPNHHVGFLRPLFTKAVLDSLLESETFGAHIDTDNIGITGHSYGGFTALAVAGGPYQENPATVSDKRIKAGALAAPWVGGNYEGKNFFAFGPENRDLNRVTAPMIVFFGTNDEDTPASFILPAARQLSGPTYVVELVDQPHIFEQGSWEDRDNWELLFFDAYLKNDTASLERLKTARSMNGGNEDVQLFDYQRLSGNH
jgi:dienelactone hydrolase